MLTEMQPEVFTFEGKPVKQVSLAKAWATIRRELNRGDLQMPEIRALKMSRKQFEKAFKKLIESPHFIDTHKEEYGTETTHLPSAFIFPTEDNYWLIVICKGYGCSLEVDLIHELLHVCEDMLGLKWGTLTTQKPFK